MGITALLWKQFIKLVLIANVIAWPIAFYVMNRWLQNFVYRIDVKIWMFLLSAFLAIAVALMTVSYQSIKAALANPIDSLRYE
jgi:putative ABC transport system permease protein